MELALYIMIAQGVLGAFDTLYYHEYVYRLPVHGPKVGGELSLHAYRDFVYAVLFLSLPFVEWHGWLALVLVALIVTEICITIWDFNTEVVERADIGGVANEERGLHLVMAVVYGFFLAHLAPMVLDWFSLPTAFVGRNDISAWVQIVCVLMGTGVLLSGLRDFGASRGVRICRADLFGRN